MNTAEETKKQFDAFMKMNGGLEEFAKGIGNMVSPFMEEQRKLLVPKSKKDITINGKTCSMSLISDGRVVIAFSTMDESENYYNEKVTNDWEASYRVMEKKYKEEKSKTWFQKLIGK